MLTRQNPTLKKVGLDATDGLMDKLKIAFYPREINVYQYVSILEATVARWMILSFFQCAALLYLAVIGGKL